jgi:hypothetical protein
MCPSGGTDVKVKKRVRGSGISCAMNFNHRIAAILCTLEIWLFSSVLVIVKTLHNYYYYYYYYYYDNYYYYLFFLWRCDPTRVMASSFLRFLDHTQRRTTVDRTPLDE